MRPAVVLALLAAVAVLRSGPPSPKPVDAPVTEFSASRAQRVLADVAGGGARPPGTAEHDRVRELLAEKLAAFGFVVERPSGFICGRVACATVTNLLVRIPGRVGANAVVLTAHYDSVPAGPTTVSASPRSSRPRAPSRPRRSCDDPSGFS